MRFRVVLAVALLATTASLAVAQITSTTVSGTIKDETGGVLPGVDVVVENVGREDMAVPKGWTYNVNVVGGARVWQQRGAGSGASFCVAPANRTVTTSRQIQLGMKVLF